MIGSIALMVDFSPYLFFFHTIGGVIAPDVSFPLPPSSSLKLSEGNHHRHVILDILVFRVCFLTLVILGVVFLCRFAPMSRKETLIYSLSIHWIYKWVDPEVLGIPSMASPEFLRLLKEEHLITPKGEYEEFSKHQMLTREFVISTTGKARTGCGCMTCESPSLTFASPLHIFCSPS